MASEICKAYIRGALVSNWFWNKLLGQFHSWNQKVMLEINSKQASKITKVFSIISASLKDPDTFGQTMSSWYSIYTHTILSVIVQMQGNIVSGKCGVLSTMGPRENNNPDNEITPPSHHKL